MKMVRLLLPLLAISLVACQRPVTPPPYRVYVTNEASGDITVIDPIKQEAVATFPLGKRPRGIQPSPDRLLIYVALSGSPFAPPGVDESKLPPPDKTADGIGVFDVRQQRVARVLPGGSDPEQLAVSGDGRLLYAANEDAAAVSLVETATGNILKTLPVGTEPEGVTRSTYATSENDGTVTVISTATNESVVTFQAGRRPRSVSFLPNGTRAFVANENDGTLTVVDAQKHKPLHAIPLGAELKPMGQAMSADGTKLYVSTGRSKKVLVIDTATEQVSGTVEVGARPWGLALSPDGKLLFTANGPSNDVSIVDVSNLTVIKRIKAGDRPWGVITLAP
jgi:YVTN family beta-propeller protein